MTCHFNGQTMETWTSLITTPLTPCTVSKTVSNQIFFGSMRLSRVKSVGARCATKDSRIRPIGLISGSGHSCRPGSNRRLSQPGNSFRVVVVGGQFVSFVQGHVIEGKYMAILQAGWKMGIFIPTDPTHSSVWPAFPSIARPMPPPPRASGLTVSLSGLPESRVFSPCPAASLFRHSRTRASRETPVRLRRCQRTAGDAAAPIHRIQRSACSPARLRLCCDPAAGICAV